jgi:hypothetical protein
MLGISGSTSETSDLVSDISSRSTSYSTNLQLSPWRSVMIVVDNSNSRSETDGTSSEGSSTNINITYRPTRNIYASGFFGWSESTSGGVSTSSDFQNYSVSWGITRKVQTSVRYNVSGDTSTRAVDLNWRPIERLTMSGGYSVSEADSFKAEFLSFRASITFL